MAAEGSQELNGRTALITGGGRGIGKAIALKLGAMGAEIAVNYNASEDRARQVVDELRGSGVPGGVLPGRRHQHRADRRHGGRGH